MRSIIVFAAVALALVAAGCASTSVQTGEQYQGQALPRPTQVLVYDFAVTPGEVVENQALFHQVWVDVDSAQTQAERETAIGHEAAQAMAQDLVEGIRKLGLPAERAVRSTAMPADALLIHGEFLNVDEGNRLRRLVIGFGSGASKIDARVRALAPIGGYWTTVNEFTTHADSGEMPGAAVTLGAGAAAQGAVTGGMAAVNVVGAGVKGYRSDVANMASRSADEAVSELARFFAAQGWISPEVR